MAKEERKKNKEKLSDDVKSEVKKRIDSDGIDDGNEYNCTGGVRFDCGPGYSCEYPHRCGSHQYNAP